MSLYLTLGTGMNLDEVRTLAKDIGFTRDDNGVLYHEKIDEFGLQIHKPAFTKFLGWINTEIEFDYEAQAEVSTYPPNIYAALILLYDKIPDLYYITDVGEMFGKDENTDFTHLFKPLSHAIERTRREYI